MPSIVSKETNSRSMAGSEPMRVFCVTGTKTLSPSKNSPTDQTTSGTSNIRNQRNNGSDTSGYLSSSSFESSGEGKRLVLNEQKVNKLWGKLGHQKSYVHTGPRNSTPKQNDNVHKKRFNISTERGHSMLAIKKNLGGSKLKSKPTSSSSNSSKEMLDSFWDIETTQLQKSRSEGDIRQKIRNNNLSKTNLKHVQSDSCIRPKSANSYVKHDAEQVVSERQINSYYKVTKSNDWKRKPFSTLSNSESDLYSSSKYASLPRYRVKVNDNSSTGNNCIVQKLHRSCPELSEQGRSVDESMTEFLANVDQENLESFLNFYDKVTSDSAYDKARRNPIKYEAGYY